MLVGQQVGPFTIDRELGSGAMGAVYLARYKDGKRVALKFMSPSLGSNEKAQARFEREAEILKQLRHPNIVRLFGHGKHAKMPYYAMEYIEGESLEEVLARRGRLPWEEVVALGKQLCLALQYAHQQGIIHRDLKPSNLMVLRDGTLKLTDFGIAKDLDVTQLTSANCTVGTASYMSPEQCKGERNLTHKSDLYSLGVVFYELLTGQKPFQAENAMDMFMAHVKGTFERPSRLVMEIPPWLDTLVCQLLEKKPEKRPFDAAMVAGALDQVVEKVTALKSAGADVLSARAMDYRGSKPDAEDKEAARALAEAMGKGRRKKKVKPLYKRAWFQALGLGLALLGAGALLVVALLPPSPERLYAEAERLMNSGDPEKMEKARDGPIKKYRALYRDREDEQAKKINFWAEQIDRARGERKLARRMSMGWSPETEAEAAAQAAVRHEEAGELDRAREKWQAAAKFRDDSDADSRSYALVAERRLPDLDAAAQRWQALGQKLDLRQAGQEVLIESETEAAALEALRCERFGDWALAYRRWLELKQKHDKDADNRPWHLLAAQRVAEAKAKKPAASEETAERKKLIEKQLTSAAEMAREAPARARAICRDVIALYGKDPDYEVQVAKAKQLLAAP